MRLVDVLLDANDADVLGHLQELRVGEGNDAAKHQLGRNGIPACSSPPAIENAVKCEPGIFVVVHISDAFLEELPRCASLGLVVTDVGIGQSAAEDGIFVTDGRFEGAIRHDESVNLGRHNLKRSGGVVVLADFKFPSCEHSGLEDDSHRFPFNHHVIEVQSGRDAGIAETVKVLISIVHDPVAHLTDTLRVALLVFIAILRSKV